MAVNIGDGPKPPITLSWEDIDRTYDSLVDLGMDLQFVEEHEYIDGSEPEPVFLDRDGRRFRILVMSLEVVFCAEVPSDYSPTQLLLRSVQMQGGEALVESLHGRDHRALLVESRTAIEVSEMPHSRGTACESDPGARVRDTDARHSWIAFDKEWLGSVDPTPPIPLTTFIHRGLRNLFRNSRPA